MLVIAWILALLCSTPQLYVWTVFELAPDWHQCTDVWKVWDTLNITTPKSVTVKNVYRVVHLIFIFWLPLFILILAYCIILKKVYDSLGEDKELETLSSKSSDSSNQDSNANRKRRWKSDTNLRKTYLNSSWKNCSSRSLKSNFNQQKLLLRRNASEVRVRRTKYRTLKITVLIVFVYILCWLPYNVLEIWSIVDPVSYELVENYLYIFYGLIAVNAVVNPLIYSRLSFILCRQSGRRERPKVRFDLTQR